MLRAVHPHQAQDSSGFVVQSGDRYTVEYLENGRIAKIMAGLAIPAICVFRDTLTDWILINGTTMPMTEADRLRVLDNIGQGLTFLSLSFKWCDGPAR